MSENVHVRPVNPAVPVSLPMLIDYMEQWRAEEAWPHIQADLVLVIYDILLLAGVDEGDMYTILGDEAVEYILTTMNSTTIPTLDELPPWEPYPGHTNYEIS